MRKLPYSTLLNLNGNLLCAVDVETTGDDPEAYEIWQIAVLPLDSQLRPQSSILPFYTELRPENPDMYQSAAVSRERLALAAQRGLDRYFAADLFNEWFERLKLPLGKRISVLAQNWVYDRGFILNWLGPAAVDRYFDARYRDTMSAALFCNDRADFTADQIQYPKVNLRYLAKTLRVENPNPHDALNDCVVTAEVYRRMVLGAR